MIETDLNKEILDNSLNAGLVVQVIGQQTHK